MGVTIIMGKNWNKNYIRIGIVITVSLCICITFGEVIKEWKSIFGVFDKVISAMTPIIVGIVLAFLLNPIMMYIRKGITWLFSKKILKTDYDKVYKKTKVPALILTLLLFLSLLVGFLWLVIPRIYTSIVDLSVKLPGYLVNAQEWIEKFFAKNEMLEGKLSNAVSYIEDHVMVVFEDKIIPNLDTIAMKISTGVIVGVKVVFNFFVGIIVTVYLLASKDVLLAQGKKIIYCIFSKKRGNKIMEGLSYANSVFGGFINGKIIDSVIIGIMCFAFTEAVDMEYAVLISVIVGVTNVIPFFGPFIGAVPGALLALMDAPVMFLIFIIWIIILQQFDGNILGPLILGDSTGLSGVWVLIAILIGGDLFGVTGMILGVPVFACLYAFCAVQLRDGLREKNLSSRTEDYYLLAGFDEVTGEPVYRDKNETRRTIKKRSHRLSLGSLLAKLKNNKNVESDDAASDSDEDTKSDAECDTDSKINADRTDTDSDTYEK